MLWVIFQIVFCVSLFDLRLEFTVLNFEVDGFMVIEMWLVDVDLNVLLNLFANWVCLFASFVDLETNGVRILRHLGWFVGLNYKGWSWKRLTDAKPHPTQVKLVAMFDAVQEVAV